MHHKFALLLLYCILCMQVSSFAYNITTAAITSRHGRTLLYPFFSQMQLSLCLVSPVFGRKFGTVAVNLGFQVMFNMPWRLRDFNRPMYWARAISDIVSGRITPVTDSKNSSRFRRYSPEVTAGQVYNAIDTISAAIGLHPECLPKSVCELVKVPFDREQENILHEIVHFILTPSEHRSFHSTEQETKLLYEAAEATGHSQHSCDDVYPTCETSILSLISSEKS
ncbi:uncharacterized protein LOC129728913 [Wyeomyia smithii]|uniref:uncharacterized protein LOC129728913 n=1 Tax=Wyeomyia smithii TaxID=174621 RepID=UPI002467BD2F|nr:uncharacterized protein LOC129728913 [Wyeomyia smithii]